MAFQLPADVPLFVWKNSKAIIPLEELETPDFENAGRVHDWRNHVLEEVKEQWDQMSLEERAVAYLAAENEADNEEWD